MINDQENISIFKYLDYTLFIADTLKERKKVDKKFTLSRMAEKIGVQKAYLSRVLKGSAHLSHDQIFMLTKYLRQTPLESRYLSLIVELNRTGLHERKAQLKKELEHLRLEASDITQKLKVSFIEEQISDSVAYYLDPYSLLVHVFLTVETFRANPSAIAKILNISKDHFQSIIDRMSRVGIIQVTGANKSIKVIKRHLHLIKKSNLTQPHQHLMRSLSASEILKIPENRRTSCCVTFSADDASFILIQNEFSKLLRFIEDQVRMSKSENVYQINFDLFPWSL